MLNRPKGIKSVNVQDITGLMVILFWRYFSTVITVEKYLQKSITIKPVIS